MALIATPPTAKTYDSLTPSDLLAYKAGLKLNGRDIYPVNYSGGTYNTTIKLEEGFVYAFEAGSDIPDTVTLIDSESNNFTVYIQNNPEITQGTIFYLRIVGTTAYCYSYNTEIQGIYNTNIVHTNANGLCIHGNYLFLALSNELVIYNKETLVEISSFTLPSSSGTYRIAADDNYIYTAIGYTTIIAKITKYDYSGNIIFQLTDIGSADGEFINPSGIAVDENYIYVSDNGNSRVQILDLDGTFVSKFGSVGSGDGQFAATNGAIGLCIDSNNIYVPDRDNQRVQIFNKAGTFLGKFGTAGSGDGQFNNPLYATTYLNRLYINDFGNNRIQIFDLNGNYISQFGNTGAVTLSTPISIAVSNKYAFVSEASSIGCKIFK